MFPEPPKPDDDHQYVDETNICHDGNKVKVQLLVRLEVFDVDTVQGKLHDTAPIRKKRDSRVQPRLGRGTHTEMVRVDSAKVSMGIQNRESQEADDDDVGVCHGSSVTSPPREGPVAASLVRGSLQWRVTKFMGGRHMAGENHRDLESPACLAGLLAHDYNLEDCTRRNRSTNLGPGSSLNLSDFLFCKESVAPLISTAPVIPSFRPTPIRPLTCHTYRQSRLPSLGNQSLGNRPLVSDTWRHGSAPFFSKIACAMWWVAHRLANGDSG